jgi:hypothetical protein
VMFYLWERPFQGLRARFRHTPVSGRPSGRG